MGSNKPTCPRPECGCGGHIESEGRDGRVLCWKCGDCDHRFRTIWNGTVVWVDDRPTADV